MANYTIELNKVVESLVQQKTGKTKYEFNSHDEMIDIACTMIFDNYELFDESKRVELNRKIIKHYFFRELIVVPYQKWRFFINEDLQRIMPYYNELYKIVAKDYDLLENLNYTETLDRDLSGTQLHENKRNVIETEDGGENRNRNVSDKISTDQSSDNDVTRKSKSVFQDTPYTQLGQSDYATDMTDENVTDSEKAKQVGKQIQDTILSDNTTLNKSTETLVDSENNSSTINKEDYTKTFKGKNSAISYAQLLLDAKRAIQNVDDEIIHALESNFSGYFN